MTRKRNEQSRSKNEALRARVAELEDTLLAIREGRVDALVIHGDAGEQVFTLQGAEHPYRVLVESISEGAATLDASGTVLFANAPCAEILGLPLEKFIGTPLASHVPLAGRRRLDALIQALVNQGLGSNAKVETKLGTDTGRHRMVRFSLSLVKDSNPQTLCVVVTDLSEVEEASEALKSSEEALRQLSARLLQLQDDERRRIARDLHDITGQKIAFLSIVLSQLLDGKPTELDAKSKSALAECLTVTQQISEEIRTLSYLLHPPLLDELGLGSAVPWYTQGYEKRTGIHVDVDIPKDLLRLPPDVEVTLFRVIQESLTNVHRYSGSSTAAIRIYSDGQEIALEISDQGHGIQTDKLKGPADSVAALGVGIQGMRERMRQLGGRLEIQSQPGEGTVVHAILPIAQAELAKSAESATGAGPNTPRKRILIADDHEAIRHGVRLVLQGESDWEVCGEASDGKEAVDKALELNPDLVIVDLNMPTINGLDTVRRIRRERPQMKVLVFTVHDSDLAMRQIIAAGAQGYLSKAQSGQDLVEVVKNLLAGKTSYPSFANQIPA
jgi:PAS domain S-box-containing protein